MRRLLGVFLSRLNGRYPDGLYVGLILPVIGELERWTLYGWVRRLARHVIGLPNEEVQTPAFVVEIYQMVWLLGEAAVLLTGSPGLTAKAFAIYRVSELLLFSLAWILSDDPLLHRVRRSLGLLMANIIEAVLLFALMFLSSGCIEHGDVVVAIFDSARTLVTIGPSGKGFLSPYENRSCARLIVGETVLAYCLTVIVIANLAGQIKRREKGQV